MSCAPSRLKISLALSTSLLSSVWTEMSTLPLRILPSYCLASYSGIPRPTSVPVRPPAAAPTAAPARAAIIGPAAMNGPTPGIASAPIPTSHPNPPPSKPPAPAPVAAPSGAFVCCSWAKSRVPPLSGNRTEMSFPENPPPLSWFAILAACASLVAMPNTALLATMTSSSVVHPADGILASLPARDLELVVDALHPCHLLRFRADRGFLRGTFDRTAQCHHTVRGNDLHVVGIRGETLVGHNRFANRLGNGHVRFGIRLVPGSLRGTLAVAYVLAGIVRWGIGCASRRSPRGQRGPHHNCDSKLLHLCPPFFVGYGCERCLATSRPVTRFPSFQTKLRAKCMPRQKDGIFPIGP